MNGYVGVTDSGWYRHLLGRQREGRPLEEINFWSPSANVSFKALRPGEVFFYRLKAPFNKIAGIGFFQRFTVLPVWLAWDSFGEGNGAGSLPELRGRLKRLARSLADPAADLESIGCRLLSNPVFFPEDQWVDSPSDWASNIVQGKGYDLTVGEGRRMWEECRERLMEHRIPAVSETVADRYGKPRLVPPRLGQGGFRIAVMEAYDRQCAVTGEHSLPVLDAAHIVPYAADGENKVSNGLFLRSDVHKLYDKGYVTVTPDLEFKVSQRLRADFDNGKTYYAMEGRRIVVPSHVASQPNRDALAWHSEQLFLG